jgi:hypothetical protein
MKAFLAKLAFAHRALWKRDETYRIAFVLGPPVLLGGVLACGLWFAPIGRTAPPWARPEPSGNLAQDGKPVAETPLAPLPHPGLDGKIAGLEPGWAGAIQKVLIGATMDPNVLPERGARFTLPPGPVDVSKIIEAGPPTGTFVGVENGVLLVREAGVYHVTVRLRRSSFEAADCLVRLGFGAHRVLSQYGTGIVGEHDETWPAVAFDLKPGSYLVLMAFGCWRGDQMLGPGELTLMIEHPNETAPQPARADEIWRPAARPM